MFDQVRECVVRIPVSASLQEHQRSQVSQDTHRAVDPLPRFFSSYQEGHQGEHGYCGCFSSCGWPSDQTDMGTCHTTCSTHEVFSQEEGVEEEQERGLESEEFSGGEVSEAHD